MWKMSGSKDDNLRTENSPRKQTYKSQAELHEVGKRGGKIQAHTGRGRVIEIKDSWENMSTLCPQNWIPNLIDKKET